MSHFKMQSLRSVYYVDGLKLFQLKERKTQNIIIDFINNRFDPVTFLSRKFRIKYCQCDLLFHVFVKNKYLF